MQPHLLLSLRARPAARLLRPACVAAALVLSAAPSATAAQGFLKRVKQAAQEAATEAAARKAGDAARAGTEKTVDVATGRAGQAIDPRAGGAGAPTATGGAPAVGDAAWANYDFVPGTRVLFVDDFTSETVGNFPRRLTHKGGSAEVVEWQGRRWLSSSGHEDALVIALPEVLPRQFTLEFDLAGAGNPMALYFDGRSAPHASAPAVNGGASAAGGEHLAIGTDGAGVVGPTRTGLARSGADTKRQVVRVRVMADGDYVKLFVDERRVVNVPNAKLGRSRQIYVALNGWSAEAPRLVGDVRVAAGGRRLYDAIAESGRVATQGILFATGQADVRPESAPTLAEIAAMLAAHPALRLTIEGHTDGAGDAAANQALSEARAAAVKAALVATYGADAAQLEARGFGASRPAQPNATPEGRAANRRVELVRR